MSERKVWPLDFLRSYLPDQPICLHCWHEAHHPLRLVCCWCNTEIVTWWQDDKRPEHGPHVPR